MKKLICLIVCIMLLGFSSVFAQSKLISGIVTDISGLELPGVSVTIYGSLEGTSSDLDGRWELKAKPDDLIVFAFIGMETRMVEVKDQVIINIVLSSYHI